MLLLEYLADDEFKDRGEVLEMIRRLHVPGYEWAPSSITKTFFHGAGFADSYRDFCLKHGILLDEIIWQIQEPPEEVPQGVSLRDAARAVTDWDDEAASATKKRWQRDKNHGPKLAKKSIGKDAKDKRTNLFRISDILSFIKDMEGFDLPPHIERALNDLVRPIRR
jgi:hypothetical protein